MKLLIDVGNSRIKWALSEGNELFSINSFDFDSTKITNALSEVSNNISKPESVWVANVTGVECEEKLRHWVEMVWLDVPVQFMSPTNQLMGLTNAYANPSKLGSDRWLAMLYAWHKTCKSFCVIDCGTTITVDVVDDDGNHLGGLISPGLSMMQNAIVEGTKGCSMEQNISDYSYEGEVIAKNTRDQIILGSIQTAVGFIERMLNQLANKSKSPPTMIFYLTGGDAKTLSPYLSNEYLLEPNLVLLGLNLWANTT